MAYDVRALERVGKPVSYDHPRYEDIEKLVLESDRSVPIEEPRQRAHGLILPLTGTEKRALEIEEEGSALLYWSDYDPNDSSDGVNVIDQETVARLSGESTGAIIQRVVEHYQRTQRDDGHPAYALFQRHQDQTA